MFGNKGFWLEPAPNGLTKCRFALFASGDLSEPLGYAFGLNANGEISVFAVEEGKIVSELNSFAEWFYEQINTWEIRLSQMTSETIKTLLTENKGEKDPHRLID